MELTLSEKIVAAVGLAWADIKREHPNLIGAIEAHGDPVQVLCKKLDEGQAYQDLVAQTNAEISVSALVDKVAPLLMTIITGLLGT